MFMVSKFFYKKIFNIFVIIFILSFEINAAEDLNIPNHKWSFEGLTGTYDKASLQRGYKVYREVCSGCHSMKLLYFRDLIDIGFSSEEVKAIANEYTVIDGPDDEGNMYERPGKASDRFVGPYLNDQEARASNNGSYPPDLSVITKAKKNGINYFYNLLLGYKETPENFEMYEGMYYNLWVDGHQIAMPAPLYDGSVEYDDGTQNTLPQLAEDVIAFLQWSAEPELDERKNLGIKVSLFFIIFGFIIFLTKRRLWKNIR
tara:strand:- start:29 stop:805 length:777 start_codon:yes stop_codon:yes gene_type:complete